MEMVLLSVSLWNRSSTRSSTRLVGMGERKKGGRLEKAVSRNGEHDCQVATVRMANSPL